MTSYFSRSSPADLSTCNVLRWVRLKYHPIVILYNEITLVMLLELYFYFRGGLRFVLVSNVLVMSTYFQMHTITIFCGICLCALPMNVAAILF